MDLTPSSTFHSNLILWTKVLNAGVQEIRMVSLVRTCKPLWISLMHPSLPALHYWHLLHILLLISGTNHIVADVDHNIELVTLCKGMELNSKCKYPVTNNQIHSNWIFNFTTIHQHSATFNPQQYHTTKKTVMQQYATKKYPIPHNTQKDMVFPFASIRILYLFGSLEPIHICPYLIRASWSNLPPNHENVGMVYKYKIFNSGMRVVFRENRYQLRRDKKYMYCIGSLFVDHQSRRMMGFRSFML